MKFQLDLKNENYEKPRLVLIDFKIDVSGDVFFKDM
jgi:hypothetical protein